MTKKGRRKFPPIA